MDKLICKEYEVSSANQPFLLEESVQCARLLSDGASWEEVFDTIQHERPFTGSPATTQSYLRAIRFRLEGAPIDLIRLLGGTDLATSRYTLLYLLMHKNRLLRELLEELIRDCVLDGVHEFPRADLDAFFADKRERSEAMREWSDTTWRKFWGNTLKTVLETGLLQGTDPLVIVPALVPKKLRTWLTQRDDSLALELLLDAVIVA